MNVRDFRALSFDCYGTLIDWETGIARELEPWAARARLLVSSNDLLEAFATAQSRAERDEPSLLYPDILRRVHFELARVFGVPPSPLDADHFARSVGSWLPFPDSVEALAALKRRQVLVVISNVDRPSFSETQARLGVRFDAVVTAQDAGCYKPELRPFRLALDILAGMGIRSDQVLHVAQSLYHDHVPAKALGLATAWLNRRAGRTGRGATLAPVQPVVPDIVVPSLQAFEALD